MTGAHFKYKDAFSKLQRLLDVQIKHEDKNLSSNKHNISAKGSKLDKMSNVAKVKIILNNDKKRVHNVPSGMKLIPSHKPKSNSVYKAIPQSSKLERHLKSVSSQAKQVLNSKKFKNSNSKPTFKPQTTRVLPNLNSSGKRNTTKTQGRPS